MERLILLKLIFFVGLSVAFNVHDKNKMMTQLQLRALSNRLDPEMTENDIIKAIENSISEKQLNTTIQNQQVEKKNSTIGEQKLMNNQPQVYDRLTMKAHQSEISFETQMKNLFLQILDEKLKNITTNQEQETIHLNSDQDQLLSSNETILNENQDTNTQILHIENEAKINESVQESEFCQQKGDDNEILLYIYFENSFYQVDQIYPEFDTYFTLDPTTGIFHLFEGSPALQKDNSQTSDSSEKSDSSETSESENSDSSCTISSLTETTISISSEEEVEEEEYCEDAQTEDDDNTNQNSNEENSFNLEDLDLYGFDYHSGNFYRIDEPNPQILDYFYFDQKQQKLVGLSDEQTAYLLWQSYQKVSTQQNSTKQKENLKQIISNLLHKNKANNTDLKLPTMPVEKQNLQIPDEIQNYLNPVNTKNQSIILAENIKVNDSILNVTDSGLQSDNLSLQQREINSSDHQIPIEMNKELINKQENILVPSLNVFPSITFLQPEAPIQNLSENNLQNPIFIGEPQIVNNNITQEYQNIFVEQQEPEYNNLNFYNQNISFNNNTNLEQQLVFAFDSKADNFYYTEVTANDDELYFTYDKSSDRFYVYDENIEVNENENNLMQESNITKNKTIIQYYEPLEYITYIDSIKDNYFQFNNTPVLEQPQKIEIFEQNQQVNNNSIALPRENDVQFIKEPIYEDVFNSYSEFQTLYANEDFHLQELTSNSNKELSGKIKYIEQDINIVVQGPLNESLPIEYYIEQEKLNQDSSASGKKNQLKDEFKEDSNNIAIEDDNSENKCDVYEEQKEKTKLINMLDLSLLNEKDIVIHIQAVPQTKPLIEEVENKKCVISEVQEQVEQEVQVEVEEVTEREVLPELPVIEQKIQQITVPEIEFIEQSPLDNMLYDIGYYDEEEEEEEEEEEIESSVIEYYMDKIKQSKPKSQDPVFSYESGYSREMPSPIIPEIEEEVIVDCIEDVVVIEEPMSGPEIICYSESESESLTCDSSKGLSQAFDISQQQQKFLLESGISGTIVLSGYEGINEQQAEDTILVITRR